MLLSVYLVVKVGYGPWVLAIGALRYIYVLARWGLAVREVKERRSSWSRIIYSLVSLSLALACVPQWRTVAEPLVGAALMSLTWSFVPDFMSLLRAESAAEERHAE
jgi:hypothetical protein